MRLPSHATANVFGAFLLLLLGLCTVGPAACAAPTTATTGSVTTVTATAPAATATTATAPSTTQSSAGPRQTVAAQPTPGPDGWTITLIPGTDQMRAGVDSKTWLDQWDDSTGTISPPAPPMFVPSVALSGERVVYSAYYGNVPQVFLYDIGSGTVTQLTDESPGAQPFNLDQIEVQAAGSLVAWRRGYDGDGIYLRDLISGGTKRFARGSATTVWHLVGNRLAWFDGHLRVYDVASGDTQTMDSPYGAPDFGMDEHYLAWIGGPSGTEIYLHDFASGQTKKIATTYEGLEEAVIVKGNVLAWAERVGDITLVYCYPLDKGEKKVLDEFGPFNPELQSDGRYVAWNRGYETSGTEVNVYDTQTGLSTKLGDVTVEQDTWPSIDAGLIAWNRARPPAYGEVIMVRTLPNGRQTQLTDSPWIDQTPVVSGNHVAWARANSNTSSSQGRGIFVATAPSTTPPSGP